MTKITSDNELGHYAFDDDTAVSDFAPRGVERLSEDTLEILRYNDELLRRIGDDIGDDDLADWPDDALADLIFAVVTEGIAETTDIDGPERWYGAWLERTPQGYGKAAEQAIAYYLTYDRSHVDVPRDVVYEVADYFAAEAAEIDAEAEAEGRETLQAVRQAAAAVLEAPKETKHNVDAAITTIYHVAPADHSGDLLSLYRQHGDEAYEIFIERWPDSGVLGDYHADYVHCHATLEKAEDHAAWYGGKIYAIDGAAFVADGGKVETDTLEFPHPMVRDEIPAEYIREVAQG